MSDDTFRQSRRKITAEDIGADMQMPETSGSAEGNPLDRVRQMQQAVARDMGQEPAGPVQNPDAPFQINGNLPPQLQEAIRRNMQGGNQMQKPQQVVSPVEDDDLVDRDLFPQQQIIKPKKKNSHPAQEPKLRATGSEELEQLLLKINQQHTAYEEVELPSKGKFYDGAIPGVLHIRPMTGEEEIFLATPRFVRKGKAIDMIFEQCIRENVRTEELLSVDRTFLLIFLRGISYTPEYDVEIKCPSCAQKYSAMIDLNDIEVDGCPDHFGPADLIGELPTTGFKYKFRLASGDDEQAITRYREMRVREYGEQNEDDTLLYRTAQLLEYVEGVSDKHELLLLLKKLPINDVAHLRNAVGEPPFGVDTQIGQVCPYCTEEFEIDLPLEANFFFPRKKKDKTPQ